ncbi:MAG: tandem-95 repeat protein [Mariniblastus sp.]|nr:tandem-95 repeat protein [Mariniblastus sp.]
MKKKSRSSGKPRRSFSKQTFKRKRQGNSKLSVGDAYEILEQRNLLATYTVDFSQLAPSDYSSTEILVRFQDDVSVDELQKTNYVEMMNHNAILSASLGEGFRADGQLFEIPVIAGQSIPDLIDYYNSLDAVDFAEPNYLMESTAVPNDQYYGGVQWGPPNINAESAWDTRTDSSSIIVGVIDSGVQYDHPDLQPNIWTNSGEIAGNGIDDDNNGYVDDFYGYDFDNDDSDPMDDNGHGTHVAGTIGAQGNNSIGVAGVGWDASLMSLKVIGNGSNADVARAIDYATDNGAKITNNSYGYAGTNVGGSSVMSAAIGRAKDAGVLYIVAAGNSRTGIPASDMDGSFNSWPAEYSKVHDNVITVAAIDEGGAFATYSHWGDESVQIAAPGTSIASTYTNDGYVYLSGTSMASPHVAGAAALLWAERPDMSYLEIKDAILNNTRADHLNLVTNGVLDLGLAMTAITSSTNSPPVAANDTATVDEDSFVAINVLQNDTDPENDTLSVQSFTNPSNGSVSANNGVLTYTPDANFNGSDSFNYTINDGNGNTDTASVAITVNAVNDNPVAADDASVTNQDTAVLINVISNDSDVDGDSLTVDSVNQPANGAVVDNGDGTVTYTPTTGFVGGDSFSYTASDGDLTDSAMVTVTVNEVNLSPVANDDNETVSEDPGAMTFNVLGNDTDGDGDSLTITAVAYGGSGVVINNGTDITYTPLLNFNGTESFTYSISDGKNGTDTATVSIVVTPVNDAPVAADDGGSTSTGIPTTIGVLANDSDVDAGDVLSIIEVSIPTNGTATIDGDQVIYTPNPSYNGSDSFTYLVGDNDGATDLATVTVAVIPAIVRAYADINYTGGLIVGATIDGSIVDTHQSDAGQQTLSEVEIDVDPGRKTKLGSALEYRWSFPGLDGANAFSVDAYQSNNADDNFNFEYSIDNGSNWTSLGTISQTSPYQTITAENLSITGDVLVRVIDTDRTPANRKSSPNLDSIVIDLMYFETAPSDLRETVSVIATDPNAVENVGNSGEFTISRETTTSDMTVFYSVGGSATSGADYSPLSGTAVIPAGSNSISITVNPIDDTASEGAETVVLTLIEDASYDYQVGSSDAATVTISDDDIPPYTYASSENTLKGTIIQNSFLQTSGDDNVVETIEEKREGKGRNKVTLMDHRWTFNGVGGAVSFHVDAARSNNTEGDDFAFSYSEDGGTSWNDLVVVNSGQFATYSVNLNSAISGDIIVKVVDTDPATSGNSVRDTVSIDQMFFSTQPVGTSAFMSGNFTPLLGSNVDGFSKSFQPSFTTAKTPLFSQESSNSGKNINSLANAHRLNSEPLDRFWEGTLSDDLFSGKEDSETGKTVDGNNRAEFSGLFKIVDDAFAAQLS